MSEKISSFPSVRVVRQENYVSGSLNVVLPTQVGQQKPEQRIEGSVYIDDYVPSGKEHHTCIGEFIDAWSRLEIKVAFLLTKLAECETRTGFVLFTKLGINQAVNTIYSLATLKTQDAQIKKIDVLLKRLDRLKSKRNIIVHGRWTLEFVVWSRGSEARFAMNLLREENPEDFRERGLIADIRNQNERVKHTFNLKRIEAARRDCELLRSDITKFTNIELSMNLSSRPS